MSRRTILRAGTFGLLSYIAVKIAPAAAQEATPTPKRVLYVDKDTGDNGNPGSQDEPFESIGRATSEIQPGDRVEIAGGTYNDEVVITTSGTKDAPITFAAASGAEVKIQKGGVKITADYITLDSLITEKVTDSDEAGIFITRGNGIILRNITARKNEGGGIKVKPADGPVLDLLITGGTCTDNDGAGIVATGDKDALVGLRVEDVTLTDNSGDGLQIERASQVTVSRVSTARNGSDDERNGVFLKQVRGAQVGGVFTEDNGHDGIALRGNDTVLISRCISRGNGHHGFDSIEGCTNITFANNVAYANGDANEDKGLYITATDGVTIQNNVFFDNVGDQLAFSNEGGDVTNISSDHNLFYRSDGDRLIRWFSDYYKDLATYQAASGLDKASISADPKFADPNDDDFTPEPDSPLIDAGMEVAGVTDDIAGKAPDIGAIEYRP